MAVLFTKKHAMKELPFIEDKNLFNAVNLALWLYLDKFWTLKGAVNKAATKYNVKPKVSIENLIRQTIPEEIIWERMKNSNRKRNEAFSNGVSCYQQRIKSMEEAGKKHVTDITT